MKNCIKISVLILFFVTNCLAYTIIGKSDFVDLPQFNIKKIEAKIDTGAKTSSLNAKNIKSEDEKNVEFEVLNKKYILPISRVAFIKSSNGLVQKRYIIKTTLKIFKKNYFLEFSLANRENMNYPILLGRNFLENGFLVDVNKQNLSLKLNH